MQPANFEQEIIELHGALGIPADYPQLRRLVLCAECSQPVSIGADVFDRKQVMAAPAARAWSGMRDQASSDGVELQVVSAFRSVDYQAGIIRKKLAAGQELEAILKVSAAPGYSEHHSGRALDLTTPGYEPLEEEFEHSPAFAWLTAHAKSHGFRMSYPRDNIHGVAYEPWHWYWNG